MEIFFEFFCVCLKINGFSSGRRNFGKNLKQILKVLLGFIFREANKSDNNKDNWRKILKKIGKVFSESFVKVSNFVSILRVKGSVIYFTNQ